MPPPMIAKMTHGTQHAATPCLAYVTTQWGRTPGGGEGESLTTTTTMTTKTSKYAFTPSIIAHDDERLPCMARSTQHATTPFWNFSHFCKLT